MEISAFETLWQTPIEEYCAKDAGFRQMLRLMDINAERQNERGIVFGDAISGATNSVNLNVYDYDYSYAKDINYLNRFQRNDAKNNATQYVKTDENGLNYKNHNKLYGEVVDLYYDDNGTGRNKFDSDKKTDEYYANHNHDSILYKTKQLFRAKKINTIISRFYTDNPNNIINGTSESASTKNYKLSHGRNLLTFDAERYNEAYNENGYKNPYCRVWTHHHQYSEQRTRLIRPFYYEDEDEGTVPRKTTDVNKWGAFKDVADTTQRLDSTNENQSTWGWRASGADNYKLSVLDNETGFVRIAPKFRGGAEKNIHTKDCMFSIENLAWQGYDPYSFEQALSWEQRGPFGGRIMWFPPYGIRFNEETSAQWNEHTFIGRGENVFTYSNTSRSGTLEFMMVVDHPSIIDYATWHNPSELKDTDILRFFAGCNTGNRGGEQKYLQAFALPTPLTDEYLKREDVEVKAEKATPVVEDDIKLIFYVFFPNNYSGYFDRKDFTLVNPITYLLAGKGAQWSVNTEDVTQSSSLQLDFDLIIPDNFGEGYEMASSGSDKDKQDSTGNYIIGTGNPNGFGKTKYIQNNDKRWYYRIDGRYSTDITNKSVENTFGQTLKTEGDYKDSVSLHLNCNAGTVKGLFNEESNDVYSLAEVAYVLLSTENEEENEKQKIIEDNSDGFDSDRIERLKELLDKSEDSIYSVTEVECIGYSNEHGNNKEKDVNNKRNVFLAQQRAETILSWFKSNYNKSDFKTNATYESSMKVPNKIIDVNSLEAKKWRSAKVTVTIKKNKTTDLEGTTSQENFKGFKKTDRTGTVNGKEVVLYENTNENDNSKKHESWYYDDETQQMIMYKNSYATKLRSGKGWTSTSNSHYAEEGGVDKYGNTIINLNKENVGDENNHLRYDQEYYFFKELKAKDPAIFDELTKKLQYFDPAFHSMTPEGFMGRLNFLQQCTRQGDTISASDKNGKTANNLAFGRPPFCILRFGDFYYQKIVIRNISISFDPLVLDLNQEGIGVVPLIANVTISFNFIGGGDLTGPVRRLQNAMSFNYYANGRLYDNRADRVEHERTNWETMGALDNNKVDFKNSHFHHTQMADTK